MRWPRQGWHPACNTPSLDALIDQQTGVVVRILTNKLRVWRSVSVALLIAAGLSGAIAMGVIAATPTPTTGGVVSSPAPGIAAATLAPTIAGGSANLPAGSQSTSGAPRITVLLIIVVIALIVLGGGFSFNRRRSRRLP